MGVWPPRQWPSTAINVGVVISSSVCSFGKRGSTTGLGPFFYEHAFVVGRVIVLGGYRPLCPMDSPFDGHLTHHALALAL